MDLIKAMVRTQEGGVGAGTVSMEVVLGGGGGLSVDAGRLAEAVIAARTRLGVKSPVVVISGAAASEANLDGAGFVTPLAVRGLVPALDVWDYEVPAWAALAGARVIHVGGDSPHLPAAAEVIWEAASVEAEPRFPPDYPPARFIVKPARRVSEDALWGFLRGARLQWCVFSAPVARFSVDLTARIAEDARPRT